MSCIAQIGRYISAVSVALPSIVCRFAHNTSGGKTTNGRDSNPKYRGIKKYGCEKVIPGNIIVRQKGTKFHPGDGVGIGRDFTIYAKAEGYVHFTWNPFNKRQVLFCEFLNIKTISITPERTPSVQISDPKSLPKRIYG